MIKFNLAHPYVCGPLFVAQAHHAVLRKSGFAASGE
jgi:hypothetical protein